MKRIVAKLVVGMAFTAIAMFGADSSIGTWKLNVSKSKYTGSSPVKNQTDVREATPDGGIKVTRTGQLSDGTPVKGSFTYKYDGKEYSGTGLAFDVVSVKRVDANTTTFEVKKAGGKYHLTGQSVISKDGKTLTQTNKGTDADGKPITVMLVYEKQ
jgi:hypothetical protein